ncbi:MAG: GHKL domain-containing protein [Tissierellia bacterium]|nr:GHKL domain-containing protein [Tissierellia bacterium]
MVNFVFHTINNLVEFYLAYIYFSIFLRKRKVNYKISSVILIILYIIYSFVNIYFNNPYFNLITAIAVHVLFQIILFDGEIKWRIISLLSYIALNIALDLLMTILFSYFTTDELNIIILLILNFIKTAIILFVKRILYNTNKRTDIKIIIVFSIYCIFLAMYGVFRGYSFYGNFDYSRDIVIALVFIISIMIFYYILGIIDKKLDFENRVKYLEINKDKDLYLKQLEEYEKHLSELKHNLKNRNIALLNYTEEERLKKIKEFVDIVDDPQKSIFTKNKLIQNLIHIKIKDLFIAKENLNININIPEELDMDKEDLSTILGNLIDNSIEAVNALEYDDRKILIDMEYKNNILIICIENSK